MTRCREIGVPIFLKNNLADIWGGELPKELPRTLAEPSWEDRPCHKVYVASVRDKKSCRQCNTSVQGRPAWRMSARYYICEKCYSGGKSVEQTH